MKLTHFGGRKQVRVEEPAKITPFGRATEAIVGDSKPTPTVYRGKARSVPTADGEKEAILQAYATKPTITPAPAPTAKEEGKEPVNVTDMLLSEKRSRVAPKRITTDVKLVESISDEEVAAFDPKRIKALLELEKQVEKERQTFLKQINKQFQDEKKLHEKIAALEGEYDELRRNYLQTMKRLSEAEGKVKLFQNNDGGFYSSVAILEEEKARMKEELRNLKIRQKSLEETNSSLSQILENFRVDLKNALDEKVMLVEKINGGLEHESRLEQENKRLKEEQKKLREEKCSIPGIISQLKKNSFCIHMYECNTWKRKVKLLRAAIRAQEPNVILAVTLFLEQTLSERNFFTIIRACRYGEALDLYIVYLTQANNVMKLIRLYTHLERYEDVGMLMLRQAFAEQGELSQHLNLLQGCVEYFRQHRQLAWYADELQLKLNDERLASQITPVYFDDDDKVGS